MPVADNCNDVNNEKTDFKENSGDSHAIFKPSCTGYLFSFLAALCSAFGNFFLKISDENKLKVVFLRSALQFLILLPYMTAKRIDFVLFDLKVFFFICLRAILSPSVMIFLGFALNYLPLGDSMAIFYTYPVLVVFFACVCLKENCSIIDIVLTFVTMGGFILVAQPSFIFGGSSNIQETHKDTSRFLGVLFAMLSSTFAALVSIVVRKLGPGVHFSQSMIFVGLEGALLVIIVLLIQGGNFEYCFNKLPSVFGCAIFYFFSQILRTLALQREKAGPITLIQTSQVIFSFLLQYIFLGEVPNMFCAIGSSLILFSCIVLAVKNILKTVNFKSKKLS